VKRLIICTAIALALAGCATAQQQQSDLTPQQQACWDALQRKDIAAIESDPDCVVAVKRYIAVEKARQQYRRANPAPVYVPVPAPAPAPSRCRTVFIGNVATTTCD
jgi:hypothetical protein